YVVSPYHCLFTLSLFSFLLIAPALTDIYPLSLHDALPIYCFPFSNSYVKIATIPSTSSPASRKASAAVIALPPVEIRSSTTTTLDRKSTRLNSSHVKISYAVFCLKKKKQTRNWRPD